MRTGRLIRGVRQIQEQISAGVAETKALLWNPLLKPSSRMGAWFGDELKMQSTASKTKGTSCYMRTLNFTRDNERDNSPNGFHQLLPCGWQKDGCWWRGRLGWHADVSAFLVNDLPHRNLQMTPRSNHCLCRMIFGKLAEIMELWLVLMLEAEPFDLFVCDIVHVFQPMFQARFAFWSRRSRATGFLQGRLVFLDASLETIQRGGGITTAVSAEFLHLLDTGGRQEGPFFS